MNAISHLFKLWHWPFGLKVGGAAGNVTIATCLRGLGSVVVILRGVERSTRDSTLVELRHYPGVRDGVRGPSRGTSPGASG
ncbi:hypothetical protein PGTUg99_029272 [Puccinia graminis f. sp. tritici]|uniref:Uncharacterized protein n=1 Tax=Puccinia graminis f. sp. tritici TaxID=56615 RepID=A0A5B0RMD4_PUCGR|nr:hypothetical protein PGTUg99_029272 [Puccinia graminis f. sp. tritici]